VKISDRPIQIQNQSIRLTGFLFWLNYRLGQVLQNQTFVISGAVSADWLPFQQHTALKELIGNHMLNFDFSWSVNWLLYNRHCSIIADSTVLISFATCWQTTSLFKTPYRPVALCTVCVWCSLWVWESIQPVKNWEMTCWRGCLSGARCKWFAYDPADATDWLQCSELGSLPVCLREYRCLCV